MTDSISRISDLSSATSGGTGSAKDKRGYKRFRHEDDHDTVTISDEARRRAASKGTEWDVSEEG
ncbi:MAG: hypothetical protein PHD01_09510 [Geobacteraceae bacterium]|nr:hypothetical protein [Geobacteraceae bacterium]